MKTQTRLRILNRIHDLKIDSDLRTDFLQLTDTTPTQRAIARTAFETGSDFIAFLDSILQMEEEGKPQPEPKPEPQTSIDGLRNPQEGNPNATFLIRQINLATGEISTRRDSVNWAGWVAFALQTEQNAIDSDLVITSTATAIFIGQPSGENIFVYDVLMGSGWVCDSDLNRPQEEGSPEEGSPVDCPIGWDLIEPEPSSSIGAAMEGNRKFSGWVAGLDDLCASFLATMEEEGCDMIGFGGGQTSDDKPYNEYAIRIGATGDIAEFIITMEEEGIFSITGCVCRDRMMYTSIEGLRFNDTTALLLIIGAMIYPQEEGNRHCIIAENDDLFLDLEEEGGSGWDNDGINNEYVKNILSQCDF